MQLAGKAALLTGGKRIGAVVADALGRLGVDVALAYARSQIEAERTVADLAVLGRRAVAVQADLSQPDACAALVATSAAALGRLDILINMASVYVQHPFDELDERSWNACIDVDLRASFLCSKAAVPHMRRQSGGRIINFSDWVARSGRPRYSGYLPYYVAKAGVIALTEALALELAPDNILVNAVAPGPILPPPHLSEAEIRAVEESTPLGHWGGEPEIAKVVLSLLESDFITGETVRVDGGRHLR
jgi:NAD(P)-dependent dehydrogenase (short-subunit alcohol dehydrogenase family)